MLERLTNVAKNIRFLFLLEEAMLARGCRNAAKAFKIYQCQADPEEWESSSQTCLHPPHADLHQGMSYTNYLVFLVKPPAYIVFCLLRILRMHLPNHMHHHCASALCERALPWYSQCREPRRSPELPNDAQGTLLAVIAAPQ